MRTTEELDGDALVERVLRHQLHKAVDRDTLESRLVRNAIIARFLRDLSSSSRPWLPIETKVLQVGDPKKSRIRRASVVILARVPPVVDPHRRGAPRDDDLELLYLKRVERPNDPYSGHVCFPGGHVEHGETSIEAAIRETKVRTSEIGMKE